MGSADDCVYGDEPHPRGPAHHHPYTPAGWMPRQCTCGSRHWQVSVRFGFPAEVVCARENCRKVNRIATAYEKGRRDGPRVRADAPAAPPY